jgi:hypothetical protein
MIGPVAVMTSMPRPHSFASPAAGLAAVWFLVALVLGLSGAFAAAPGSPPVGIGLAAVLPALVVLGLLAGSARFRAWARGRDVRLLSTLQAWRAGGIAFLALGAVGALPLGFALPAGLGDIIVGLRAPSLAAQIDRGVMRRASFLAWNAFGMLDLVVAVTLGVLYSDSALGILAGELHTTPISQLPMSMIPTFFVPFLFVVHILSMAAFRHRLQVAGRDAGPSASPVAAGPAVTA